MKARDGRVSRAVARMILGLQLFALPFSHAIAQQPAAPAPVSAPTGFSSWDVQMLYGTRFHEPGIPEDVSKATLTIENSSGWDWGSSYFFVDVMRSDGTDSHATEAYAEWFPSASLGKLTGRDLSFGPVSDVSATLGINAGTKNTGAAPFVLLPGVTLDLKLPGFAFFSLGAYAYVDRGRFEGESNGCHSTSYQVTPSWALPFRLGDVQLSFDGFIDFIGSHGACESQIVSQPQLKVDLASFGAKPGVFQVGIEWQYWRNKFGIEGLKESFPQALFVWKY